MLVLETKGQDTDQDRIKRASLAEWIEAVNQQGGFGRWAWGVSQSPREIHGTLACHPYTDAGTEKATGHLRNIHE